LARLKHHFEFIAGMYIDNEVYFNKYMLMLEFVTLDSSIEEHGIALDRMSYFIHNTAGRSIFIDEGETKKMRLLANAGLPVLSVPSPGAFDPVVLAIIVTKANAIMEGHLQIFEAEIMSEISGALVTTWDDTNEIEIHETVNDLDLTKWWAASEPRFDSYPPESDVEKIEDKSPWPVTWEMLDLGWPADGGPVEFTVDETEDYKTKKKSTIIKADFARTNKKK